MNTLALRDMPGGFLLLFIQIVSSNLYLDRSSVDQRSPVYFNMMLYWSTSFLKETLLGWCLSAPQIYICK